MTNGQKFAVILYFLATWCLVLLIALSIEQPQQLEITCKLDKKLENVNNEIYTCVRN